MVSGFQDETAAGPRSESAGSSRAEGWLVFARRCGSLVLLAVLFFMAGSVAFAQETEELTTREQRAAVRDSRAEAAAALDAALTEDADLERALEELDANVASRRERAEAAGRAVLAAQRELTATQARIDETQVEIEEIRSAAARSAVAAYIEGSGHGPNDLFTAEDLNEIGSREALGSTVRRSHTDVIDDLRVKEEFLDLEREALATAESQLLQRRDNQEQQVDELEAAVQAQQVLRAKLADRIEEFQAEVDALDLEEARLAALIKSEDERIIELARAEAERREEQARRQRELALSSSTSGGSDSSSDTSSSSDDASGALHWPAFGGTVTSEFGPRWGRQHQGIDIAAPTGTDIYAAESGTVITASWYGGYGNAVLVDHGNGFVTLYGHMTSIGVSLGQSVERGQFLGAMGCTGSCTGPHLHFETRFNGSALNPRNYL